MSYWCISWNRLLPLRRVPVFVEVKTRLCQSFMNPHTDISPFRICCLIPLLLTLHHLPYPIYQGYCVRLFTIQLFMTMTITVILTRIITVIATLTLTVVFFIIIPSMICIRYRFLNWRIFTLWSHFQGELQLLLLLFKVLVCLRASITLPIFTFLMGFSEFSKALAHPFSHFSTPPIHPS